MRHAATLEVGLALALALAACSRRESDADRTGTTRTTGASSENQPAGAPEQGQSKEDIDVTTRVQRMITDDPTLSTQAKTVRVATRGGMVTLRGQVKDQRERDIIGQRARQIPGVVGVENQLEIVIR